MLAIGNNKYAVRKMSIKNEGDSRLILMHRLISGVLCNVEVDHIDGNGLNNRRSNIRVATHTQNMCNRKIHCNNTSGFKGVSWCKRNKKWRSYIRLEGKLLHLGYFYDSKKAHEAYSMASILLHKEFSRLF
ncbi:MAG: HNH endonuclease [Candidatus Omnitrophota bacterium]|jgi:hypothetical protein